MRPRVLFDTTRLAWRARRGSPTGIDRVVSAYAEWLLSRDDIDLIPVALAGSSLTRVSRARLQRAIVDQDQRSADEPWTKLSEALCSAEPDQAVVRRPIHANPSADWLPIGLELGERMLNRAIAGPPGGQVYINVAHTGLHRPGLLAGLTWRGIASMILVHDLIPITHPEFCTPSAAGRHRLRIDHVLGHAGLVIANSQCTADALSAYARRTGQAEPAVQVAHLGLAPVFARPPQPLAAPRPYFVCVGTIEARKNLAFLLTVWRRLAETTAAQAPHLVLVGRRGWENEAVIDHLDRSPAVRSLVHEIADVTDDQLARLIGGARALLAPSLVEGFDLPPIEALALGVPVIASDIPVHRELAKGATLIDPLDGPAWIEAIVQAAQPGASRPGPARPPSWSDHFALVAPRLDALIAGERVA